MCLVVLTVSFLGGVVFLRAGQLGFLLGPARFFVPREFVIAVAFCAGDQIFLSVLREQHFF